MKHIIYNLVIGGCIFVMTTISAHTKATTNQAQKQKNHTIKLDHDTKMLSKSGVQFNNPLKALSFQIKSEGRIQKNKIDKNNQGFYPFLPYAEIELQYDKNKNTSFVMELALGQKKHNWDIELDELSFSYSFTLIPIKLNMGLLSIPLGYREKNKYVFSREFSFYPILKTKREDIALTTQLILKKYKQASKLGISLQGSIWGGWSWRASDKTYKPPDKVPFILSLKGQGYFWSAFLSWFQQDSAFFNPLKAMGGGVHLKHTHKKLTLSFQSALWHIQEENQSTIAYFGHPSLTLYKVTAGLGLGWTSQFFPNFKHARVQSALYDKAFYMAFQAHPNIKLIGERRISGQDKGPLTVNLWSFRIKLHLDF